MHRENLKRLMTYLEFDRPAPDSPLILLFNNLNRKVSNLFTWLVDFFQWNRFLNININGTFVYTIIQMQDGSVNNFFFDTDIRIASH